MTGRDGMSDAEVRAELERIGLEELWDQASNIKATLYAKNGSTVKMVEAFDPPPRTTHFGCKDFVFQLQLIARKHWKGGSNGTDSS